MHGENQAHVMTCLAEECSYNRTDMCCAPSIEVGNGHPRCDTFTTAPVQTTGESAPVRDCKATECHFNRDLACEAAGITLDVHLEHADCRTFRH